MHFFSLPSFSLFLVLLAGSFASAEIVQADLPSIHKPIMNGRTFNRISSFPVYLNTSVDQETVAEIVDVSKDGTTLVYTDGVAGRLGFVDILIPSHPKPLGSIDVQGEPTSVAVAGKYALTAVNTSDSYVDPSGKLLVVEIKTQQIVANFDLGGQPDSVAVSPDGHYAAIAIENERDESVNDGTLPQGPSGYMVVVDLHGEPSRWNLRSVTLTGFAELYPTDVEPEFVDINAQNIAVVTLQENNEIVLVDLPTAQVIQHFSAGSVDLFDIDTKEEDPALIKLSDSQLQRLREPDGVAWLTDNWFVTADEGDLNGGSRGITVLDRTTGQVVFNAGNNLDYQAVRTGHYPDGRSKNKGNEPENVDVGRYGKDNYMFVASERANVIFVYLVDQQKGTFELKQTLPAGVGPEGIKAIPRRNLLVAANEVDDRGDSIRSVLSIYRYGPGQAQYPTLISSNREDGKPIPWAALSGLTRDLYDGNFFYTLHDSFFQQSRIYRVDTRNSPALIDQEIVLYDELGKLGAVQPQLVNDDKTVNLDAEGISTSSKGGFWIASEGAGTVGDTSRPVTSKNLLLHVDSRGLIDTVVTLPESTNGQQRRFGLEGVASVGAGDDEVLFVAFQREWANDPQGYVRIGRYEVVSGQWSFYYYPLDPVESPHGGWVGLSEITALGKDEFAVIERDNQGNTDARIKRIYKLSVAGLKPLEEPQGLETPSFPVVKKTLMRDLLPVLQSTGGMVLEKVEGLALTELGDYLIVTDNDGVDDASGETQLIKVKNWFNLFAIQFRSFVF